MGQHEVMEVLKKNYPKFLTCEEIKAEVNMNMSNIYRCLRSMRMMQEIQIERAWYSNKAATSKAKYRVNMEEENGTK